MRRLLILVMSFCLLPVGCDKLTLSRESSVEAETISAPEQQAPQVPQPVVTQMDLTKLSASPAVAVSYSDGLPTILGGDRSLATSGYTEGAFLTITPELEAGFAAKSVTIIVRARSATETDAGFGVAYSTAEVGNSGWQEFVVGIDGQEFRLAYDVPPMKGGNGDYIGFFASPAITLESVRIETEP